MHGSDPAVIEGASNKRGSYERMDYIPDEQEPRSLEGRTPSYRLGLLNRFKRHWLASALFLTPLTAYFLSLAPFHLSELYQHVLLTISAVMGIHVLDRLFLIKDTEDAFNDLIEKTRRDLNKDTALALGSLTNDIRHDIAGQTDSLIATSRSLEAMERCGMVQIYTSRSEAAADIRRDIVNPANSEVALIGISLNDFVQEMDRELTEAWNRIDALVKGLIGIKNKDRGLTIRILIVDPLCFGAKLRSQSESESPSILAERLESDVNLAARGLQKLMDLARPKETGVRFECRLYRLPPMLFLCWTDSTCYVQQYHFWSSRDNRTPIPVKKFRRLDASAATYPYHSEMRHHFEWIWKHASTPVDNYLQGAEVGTDQGLYQCGCVNIFTDPAKASERIIHLLKGARKKVSIQGISLNSFFKLGRLRDAVVSLLERNEAELEILLLHPESEQARYRSYRESQLVDGEQSYEEYLTENLHLSSELFRDTGRTIENIVGMVRDIKAWKKGPWSPLLKVGLYASAPSCFLLRIDDRVLVEQYHYGKVVQDRRAILGKDMPLVEYSATTSSLYAGESDPLRMPFGLLVSHFDFALEQAIKIVIP